MLNDGLKRLELIFNLVPVYPIFSHCPRTSCFKSCKKFPTSDIMLQIFATAFLSFFFPFSEFIPNFFSVFSHDLDGVWNITFFFKSFCEVLPQFCVFCQKVASNVESRMCKHLHNLQEHKHEIGQKSTRQKI